MTYESVIVGIISGFKVIETWRTMMGATRPEEALPGTIRGDFAKSAGENQAIQNVVHGSDSEESVKREIGVNLVKNSFFYGKLFCYLKSTRDKILSAILLL